MKRMTLILAAALVFAANVAGARDGGAYMKTDTEAIFEFKDSHITVDNKGEFIEITTRNNTLRVYPCGQVDKLTWEKINRNEDRITDITGSAWGISVTPSCVLTLPVAR